MKPPSLGERLADDLIVEMKPILNELADIFRTVRAIHIIESFEKDKELELLRELLKGNSNEKK